MLVVESIDALLQEVSESVARSMERNYEKYIARCGIASTARGLEELITEGKSTGQWALGTPNLGSKN